MLIPLFAAQRGLPPLNGLEAPINHEGNDGKRLIICNGLDSLGIVARTHQWRQGRHCEELPDPLLGDAAIQVWIDSLRSQ